MKFQTLPLKKKQQKKKKKSSKNKISKAFLKLKMFTSYTVTDYQKFTK